VDTRPVQLEPASDLHVHADQLVLAHDLVDDAGHDDLGPAATSAAGDDRHHGDDRAAASAAAGRAAPAAPAAASIA